MTRRWTTPVIWLAFTVLATVVGLVSVSVVRHAVVATSLRPTAASDVAAVVGSASPTPTAEPTLTTPDSSSPTPRPTHPRPAPSATSTPDSPTPTDPTPTTPSPTPPPSPSGPALFTQAYPQGTIEVACNRGSVQVMYVAAAPNYVPEWAPNERGGIDFVFHPADGFDQGNELAVSVSCQHGVATWHVDH